MSEATKGGEPSSPSRLATIKREYEGKPQWWTFLTHDRPDFIDELRRGIAFWVALQKRAGLEGEVAVWSTRDGAPKELETVSLDDVDGILHRALDCINHDLTQYHDQNCGDADWPATQIPHARFSLGVLDKAAGRLLSAIAHDGDGAKAVLLRADDADEMDAPALRASIDRYLDGEGPPPRQIVGKDYDAEIGPSARRKPWQHMQALRCVASTIQGGVVHGSVTLAADAIRATVNVFAVLDKPAEREWSVSDVFPRGCWLGREGDDVPSPWEHGIEEPIVNFETFDFHVADMIALARIAYSQNGDPNGLPIVGRAELSDRLERWYGLRESVRLYARSVPRAGEDKLEYLVRGLVPLGEPILLAASSGAGKGAVAQWLTLLVGVPQNQRAGELPFLDVAAESIGHGSALFISVEDGAKELADRKRLIKVGKSCGALVAYDEANVSIDTILADLEGQENLKLVVLDCLGPLCPGELDDRDVIRPWHAKVKAFARRKNCAVIAIHHFNKGVDRRPGGGTVDDISGSYAIVAAFRAVITMRKRAKGLIALKVEKSNLTGLPEREIGLFARDEETWTLRKASGNGSGAAPAGADSDSEETGVVCRALKSALADGARITRTGRRELFELKRPELAGWSRARTRGAIEAAIASGSVHIEVDGGLTMSATE